MGLRLVFADAKTWKYLVDTLSRLIDEATFIATPQALTLRALDPSRIAMADLEIPAEAFEEYECTEEEIRIGVNFDELKKIMRRGRAKDKFELEVGDEKKLNIRFKGHAVRTFVLPLLDLGSQQLPTPKIPITAHVKVLSDAVADALKDASIVSDYVRFEANEERFVIKASSDRGNVEVDFSQELGSLIELDVKEQAIASYSLDYLTDMSKTSAIADIVTLEYASNKPLIMTYDLPGGGRLTFYLAPRME